MTDSEKKKLEDLRKSKHFLSMKLTPEEEDLLRRDYQEFLASIRIRTRKVKDV